jgi:signal transduction histidine kinase
MISSDNRLFCRIDGVSFASREQQRLRVITELSLHTPGSIPIFEEATQMVAHTLDVPICILGLMDSDRQQFKSAVGLSRLGILNPLATSRQLPRSDSFCTHVVDSHQVLMLQDTLTHPAFANSLLTHHYGIRAYLGIPLLTSRGCCIGTLAVMDLVPRSFSQRDIEFLELTARWSMSELERQQMSQGAPAIGAPAAPIAPTRSAIANQLKVELLSQLTQELRTPLTSVMGMASMLSREIYGPLTDKQREYTEIIHRSGQYLLSLVNEILELSAISDSAPDLNLTSVDIEMLCQQVIQTLGQAAQRREQEIRLSVEPGRRVWLLDRDKLRQMLYHLVFSVMQSATAGSIVRLHVSRRGNGLNIAVWVSHPWLGEGLPYAELSPQPFLVSAGGYNSADLGEYDRYYNAEVETSYVTDLNPQLGRSNRASDRPAVEDSTSIEALSESLGLLLCGQLAEIHGGQLAVQGTTEAGCRYVISLPQIAGTEA